MSDLPLPERVLAVGAHADDIEFGCGATLAKWAAGGAAIELCVLTDGSKGSWDPETDVPALITTRRREQEAAAETLGAKTVHFLDLVDGELVNDLGAQGALSDVIRRVRPDVVLGQDPWKRYRLHPDHRAAGFLTIDAIVAARDPHFFPGRGEPHRPDRLLLFEADVVDHVEDVHDFIDTKIQALLAHTTQWRSTMAINPDDPDTEPFAAKIRQEAKAAADGTEFGLGEAFKLIEPL